MRVALLFLGLLLPVSFAAADQPVWVNNGAVSHASESVDDVLARERVHPTPQGNGPPLEPMHLSNYQAEKDNANSHRPDDDERTDHAGNPGQDTRNSDNGHSNGNSPRGGGIDNSGTPGMFISFQDPGGCGCEPPDPILCVGPTHVLAAINDNVRAFDKNGSSIWSTTWESFFASVNPAGSGSFSSDPKVFYDPGSQRFFATILMINSARNKSWWMLAVSQSSSITGSTVWNKWSFDPTVAHASTFADYPGFGYDGNAVYITSNMFNSSGTSFIGVDMAVIPKAQLIQASPPASPTFTQLNSITTSDGTGAFTIQPAQMLGTTSTNCFFASVAGGSSSKLYVYHVNNPTTTPTLTKSSVTVAAYSTPPHAVQQGTATTTNTGDTRMINAVWRNNTLWCAHNTSSSSRCCARWYAANTTSFPTVSLAQSGTITANSAYSYYPSISVDSQNNALMGFTRSSSTEYPSAYHVSRLSGDATNTMSAPVLDHAGLGGYTGSRWGDFSGTVIDPADDRTFWTIQEYGASNGSGGSWSNWISSFVLNPVCVAPSVTGDPSTQTVCLAHPATFTVTATGTTPSYQWRKNTANIGGATNASYTILVTNSGSAGSYDCVVTNGCGTDTSAAATLTIDEGPSVTQQPMPATACAGGNASFSAAGTGVGTVSYQWQWQRTGQSDWIDVVPGANTDGVATFQASGEAGQTLTVSGYQEGGISAGGSVKAAFLCNVSEPCGSAPTDAATLTINSADFNGDGDVGTDLDIQAFFQCLAGNCCAGCGTADFNGDGDIGTDLDIEAFFSVLAGGGC